MKREMEIDHQAVLKEGMLCTPRAETDFVKAITHELRTPLNVIIGLCQLLERDRKTPLSLAQKDAVDRMERNAQSLLQSINHLLACMRNGQFK